jgi:hypothetical protein
LMIFSGVSRGALKSDLLEGFHRNILLALWVSPLIIPIILWILWRVSVRAITRRSYTEGTLEDPAWERGITMVFCSLLLFTVAWLLATKGHHL